MAGTSRDPKSPLTSILKRVVSDDAVAPKTKSRVEALYQQAERGTCSSRPPPVTSPDREVWEEWCKVAEMTQADATRFFHTEAELALAKAHTSKQAAAAAAASAGHGDQGRDRVYSLSSEVSHMTKSVMTAHSGSAMVAPVAKRTPPPVPPPGADTPGTNNTRLRVALGPRSPESAQPVPAPASSAAPSNGTRQPQTRLQTPTKPVQGDQRSAADLDDDASADADADAITADAGGDGTPKWPRAVRGQVLKLCTGHGWQPRYMRVAPWEKLFMYMRTKEDRDPRVALELDSAVKVAVGRTITRVWPGIVGKTAGYEFVMNSPVGRMRFVVHSAKRRQLWVEAMQWSISRDAPLHARSKLAPLPPASESGANFTSPASAMPAAGTRSPSRRAAAGAGDDAASDATPTAPTRADMVAAVGITSDAQALDAAVSAAHHAAESKEHEQAQDDEQEEEEEEDPNDPGDLPSEGVPDWIREAGEAQIRELLAMVAPKNRDSNWTAISSGETGLDLYSASGQYAGGRGDSVVRWPPSMILDVLQTKRDLVDDQLDSHTQLAEHTLHYTISHLRYKTPSSFVARREFITMTHWRVIAERDAREYGVPAGTLILAASSKRIDRIAAKVPSAPGHTRGFVPIGGWVLRPRAISGPNNAIVDATYMSTLDPKGSIPGWVTSISTRKQGFLARRISTILADMHGAASYAELHGKSASPKLVRNLGAPRMRRSTKQRAAQSSREATAAVSSYATARTSTAAAAAASPTAEPGPPRSALREAALPAAALPAATPSSSDLFAPQDVLALPVEDKPELKKSHRCNPVSALVLLLPLFVWLLAAIMVPSAFNQPAVTVKRTHGSKGMIARGKPDSLHLPMPPAMLLSPAKHVYDAFIVAARVRMGVDVPAWLKAQPTNSTNTVTNNGLDKALAAIPGLGLIVVAADPATAVHLLVLACVIFTIRSLYRAWVGPAWMSTRQKFAIASWNPPMEGNMQGALTLDATKALRWIAQARDHAGIGSTKVTLTHMIIKAVGLALRACPQVNGRIVLGEFLPAGTVDVGCLVALDRIEANGVKAKDLAYAKITDADSKAVWDIAGDVAKAAGRIRSHKDKDFEASKGATKLLPTWLLRPLTHFLGWLSSAVGVSLPFVGVRAHPIGSCMVTAVGGLGLDVAYAPFTPFLHVPLLVTIGAIKDAVIPVDGVPAVRKVVTITATVDHRCVDGAGAGVLAKVLRAVFASPDLMLGSPTSAS